MEQRIIPTKKTNYLEEYVDLDEIVEKLTISKSTWRRGVKSGKYPRPYQISPGRKAWKLDELRNCTNNFPHA